MTENDFLSVLINHISPEIIAIIAVIFLLGKRLIKLTKITKWKLTIVSDGGNNKKE